MPYSKSEAREKSLKILEITSETTFSNKFQFKFSKLLFDNNVKNPKNAFTFKFLLQKQK